MPGMTQQIQSGMGDLGKIPMDVFKGVADVGKNTLSGTVEGLTGMNVGSHPQPTNAGGDSSEKQKQQQLVHKQAEQKRLEEVQREIQEYSQRIRAEKEQKLQVVEQQEGEKKEMEEKKQESKAKQAFNRLIKSATKGTGEKPKSKM